MRLILNISSNKQPLSDFGNRVEFDRRGGGIGRAQDNACVLPDPERFISSQHALIQFQDDAYLLTDTSVNGVFLNASDQPVGKNNTVTLRDGDCLMMGDYELRVAIEPENHPDNHRGGFAQPEFGAEPDEVQAQPSPWGVPDTPGNAPDIYDGNKPHEINRGFADWDKAGPSAPPPRRPATEPDHIPVEQEHFAPPAMQMGEEAPDWDRTDFIPRSDPDSLNPPASDSEAAGLGAEQEENDFPDWDRTSFTPAPVPQDNRLPARDSGVIVRKEEPSVPAANLEAEPDTDLPGESGQNPEQVQLPPGPDTAGAAPVNAGDAAPMQLQGEDAVRVFLQAAGLDAAQLPPAANLALMKLFGGLYRDIVQGLMDVLRARADLKNEFRMRHTQISAKENNPLKFSGRVDEALEHLVFNHGDGFLSPEAAVQEAFQDIKDHQIAMVVGMRAAFDSLLRRFDPEQLEQRVTKGKKLGNLLPVNRKANCWDRYEEWYAEISAAADDDFQGVFGDEFTRAYEDQVARLSLLRKKQGG